MSEAADENTLHRTQPSRVRFNEDDVQRSEEERLRKVEEDKARKDKVKHACSPWSPEAWKEARAARAAIRAGVMVEPVQMIPIIINEFLTPEMVQEICDLPSPPQVDWIMTAPAAEEETQEKLQYCTVPGRESRGRIQDALPGKFVDVWFEGNQRYAWEVTGETPKNDDHGSHEWEQKESLAS